MAQTLFATATSQPGLVASPPPVSGVSQIGGLHLPQEGFHLYSVPLLGLGLVNGTALQPRGSKLAQPEG
jgi:hypothetical protein